MLLKLILSAVARPVPVPSTLPITALVPPVGVKLMLLPLRLNCPTPVIGLVITSRTSPLINVLRFTVSEPPL